MITTASANYVRMSPRKVRYVIDLVRNKNVSAAYSILDRNTKRACGIVKKLIKQAVDSAEKQHQISAETLYVSKIYADGAGMMKRFRAMSMGRAGVIRKRLSHITVELDSRGGRAVQSQPGAQKPGLKTKEHPKAKATSKPKASKPAAHKKPAKKLAGAK